MSYGSYIFLTSSQPDNGKRLPSALFIIRDQRLNNSPCAKFPIETDASIARVYARTRYKPPKYAPRGRRTEEGVNY